MVARLQMNGRRFIWDDRKAARNIEKHGIDFIDAGAVFDDSRGMVFADALHSDEEDRHCFLGYDVKGRLLRVSFCYRSGDALIRLISARTASREERYMYAHDRR